MASTSGASAIPTGFHDLDQLLGGGFHRSDLIVLASATSMGKTALVLSIANNITKNKGKVMIFTLQMKADNITEWLVSIEFGLDSKHVTKEDVKQLLTAGQALQERNLWYTDETRLTSVDVQNMVKDIGESEPLDLIIIDDMKHMNTDHHLDVAATPRQKMSLVSSELKILAKRLNTPVLTTVCVSSGIAERSMPIPILSDLREEGTIEPFSDVVLFLHRDQFNNPGTERRNLADIVVAKNHHGSLGHVGCSVDIARHAFRDLEPISE